MSKQGNRWVVSFGIVCALGAGADHAIAQPVAPAQHLIAFDGEEDDEFGWNVATTGQYMAISAIRDDDLASNSGAVYIYKLAADGMSWEFQTKITETDTTINGTFGGSVAMTPGAGAGDGLLVIGHRIDNEFGTSSGAVFIHAESSITSDPWDFQKKITADDAGVGKCYGESVAIDNSTLIVGSPDDNEPAGQAGSAFIHYRTQGGANGWGQVKKLLPPDPSGGKVFGGNVALDGNIAVVSAYGDPSMGTETGAAYVYMRHTGGLDNWGFVKKLLAPDPEDHDQFGYDVAVDTDCNVIAIGSRSDDNVANRAGATFLYGRNVGGTTNWGLLKKLSPPDGMNDAFIGTVVAMHDGILITGSRSDYGVASNAGAFYVYGKDIGGADNWGLLGKVYAPDAMSADHFAYDIDIRDGVIISGARVDNTIAGVDSGSAHIFTVDSLCPADLNGDGVVDTADLGILLGSFGGSGLGDLNLDGVIDTADLGILLGGFSSPDCVP